MWPLLTGGFFSLTAAFTLSLNVAAYLCCFDAKACLMVFQVTEADTVLPIMRTGLWIKSLERK